MQIIDSGVNNSLGATSAAVVEFLRGVVSALKKGYRPGAKWMMNGATLDILQNLKDANNNYYLNRNIAEAEAQRLFGYPIVVNEDMADVDEAADSFPIMFGDFARAYQIIDRTGVSVLRDPYTNAGSIMFYTRKRVGSMLLDVSAVKVVSVNHV